MKVTVKPRSKNLKAVTLFSVENFESILEQISKLNNIDINRLRLTYKKENKQIPISSFDYFKDNAESVVYIKDLGPQISWRLVFIVEYFGPILVHSILYALHVRVSLKSEHMPGLRLADESFNSGIYMMILGHYLKREFETFFIHSFSRSTMPLFNLFKNSFHYWILNGSIGLSYFGYGFLVTDGAVVGFCEKYRNSLIGLFITCEILNLYTHIELRRWGDEQKRMSINYRLPLNTGVFKYFVAPNYTFEVYSWLLFSLVTKMNVFSVIFLLFSTVQLYLWANKKNKGYGTKRAFLIPFIF